VLAEAVAFSVLPAAASAGQRGEIESAVRMFAGVSGRSRVRRIRSCERLRIHANVDSADFPQGLSDRVSWMVEP